MKTKVDYKWVGYTIHTAVEGAGKHGKTLEPYNNKISWQNKLYPKRGLRTGDILHMWCDIKAKKYIFLIIQQECSNVISL